jgi:hypothetical protein
MSNELLLKALQVAIVIAMGAAMFARADNLYALSKALEGGEPAQTGQGGPGWWRLFPFKFLGMALICAGGVAAYQALLS